MRSIPRILAIATVAMVLSACSAHKATGMTSQGPASVSNDNGTATIQTNQGTEKVGKDAIDPAKLGAPIYPGAQAGDSGGMSTSTATGSTQLGIYKTPDDFDKVYAFYKAQLPAGSEKMKMATDSTSEASFVIGADSDPEQTSVTITAEAGKGTTVMISHRTGKVGGSAP